MGIVLHLQAFGRQQCHHGMASNGLMALATALFALHYVLFTTNLNICCTVRICISIPFIHEIATRQTALTFAACRVAEITRLTVESKLIAEPVAPRAGLDTIHRETNH